MSKMLFRAALLSTGLLIFSAPALAETCFAGPFMVFFDSGRAVLPQGAARKILDNVIEIYQSCGQAQVMIAGHTDRYGTESANKRLALRRANAVRNYLVTHGMTASRMRTQSLGESSPLVETEDGLKEPQNNRVEISFRVAN